MEHKITAYKSIVENSLTGATFLALPLDERVQKLNHENNHTQWVADLDVESDNIAEVLRALFQEIKHGDQEHQDWLEKKIEDFIEFRGF